jgi:hypothetical protein
MFREILDQQAIWPTVSAEKSSDWIGAIAAEIRGRQVPVVVAEEEEEQADEDEDRTRNVEAEKEASKRKPARPREKPRQGEKGPGKS